MDFSIKPALVAGAGAAIYHYASDGVVAYPEMALGIAGSVLYDMMGTKALMITKMDVKSTRALFVFGTVVAGSYLTMPLAPMQTRLIDGALAAVGAYAVS